MQSGAFIQPGRLDWFVAMQDGPARVAIVDPHS